MGIVAYRLYCTDCENETVITEDGLDDSPWKISSLPYHEGLCPHCSQIPSESVSKQEEVELEELDNIGEKAAQNLREGGYNTFETIVDASDEELLDVSWVGEKALFSLKEAVQAHPPQQRW